MNLEDVYKRQAEIKGWLLVKYINSVAKYLSQKFREASFPFAHAISGIPELPSQIKQAYLSLIHI